MDAFNFHPLVARWFQSRFAAPSEPQQRGWPPIGAGRHTLIVAPTGSGKTLTAFLGCIDRLFKEALVGHLDEGVRVVYVSPLRALSNDMHRNLLVPLEEIAELARAEGVPVPEIRVGLRTGDTSASQRAALVRRPPHILVTTPESLYLMLTSPKARQTLERVETVIVDEIHALVRDKRGSHLTLTLERLADLTGSPLQRIGLSATQRPIERTAHFLVGAGSGQGESDTECEIVDVGHARQLDLAIEVPPSELGAACMHEQWAEVNARLVELIQAHRSTLIFVNTRRMAERLTHQLTELLGENQVGSHHGSLAAPIRLDVERRLKSGELKAVVATASLELGIDIGYIDLVVQIGSPRSIATFLQRIGRAGHSLGLVPKGRLFALTRDQLLECMGLMRAVRRGRLDVLPVVEAPLDILAQQIVAEVSSQERGTDELFALFRRAWPYRNLSRADFDATVAFLSEGVTRSGGRSRAYLHHDQVQGRLKARRGARIAATTNAGAIPEIGAYRVVAQPEGTVVGSLDEDFAVESNAGDIFLLGNTSWRVLNVRGGDVNVADAQGAPPSVPFWRGEAPGRTYELSQEVSLLREELESRLDDPDAAEQWLVAETCCCRWAAQQMVLYAAAQKAAIGLLPTQRRVVFERFFDETGGMQMVVHAPFGGAINQAWGFAMRKRFCRSFDFELQATADDDGFILSLGPQHSFPLESMFPMLNPRNARPLLEQAVLTVPMFQTRWRWNVTRALLVLRFQYGKKVPPHLQRFRADDLLTAVFPKLTGCQENVVGDLEVPDHPLARQSMEDCLSETLDIAGLQRVLAEIESGQIELIARDTREPSPFCYGLLNANPYAFLDGGEVQERRARALSTPRSLSVESVADLGRLDRQAIEQVRLEAQPLVRDADELHDALLGRILLPVDESDPQWQPWYEQLVEQGRAATFTTSAGMAAWVAAERLPQALAVFPQAALEPALTPPEAVRREWETAEARTEIVRGLIEVCGPITTAQLASRVSITESQAEACLEALEGEGVVLRGHFTPPDDHAPPEGELTGATQAGDVEWCHRRLLARIHRLTLDGLRQQVQPVTPEVFIRYLGRRQGLLGEKRSGVNGLFEVVAMLQGIDAAASSWEADLLPMRIDGYESGWLDELCLAGEVGWGRLFPPKKNPEKSRPMASLTRVAPISLYLRSDVGWLTAFRTSDEAPPLSGPAAELLEVLQQRGAMFAADLAGETRQLPGQIEDALGELVSRGLVTSDGFDGLRKLVAEKPLSSLRALRRAGPGLERRRKTAGGSGRWSLWRRPAHDEDPAATRESVEHWAWQLLRRWGVVFRDLMVREPGAPPWFELLRVYRRLEARGEIRGGRFISGVAGEQFALPETVRQLRQLRDQGPLNELLVVSAADPLNLVGILTPQPRVPSTASNRVAYLDGQPAAALQGGELLRYQSLDPEFEAEIEQRFGLRSAISFRRTAEARKELPLPERPPQPIDVATAAQASRSSVGELPAPRGGRPARLTAPPRPWP